MAPSAPNPEQSPWPSTRITLLKMLSATPHGTAWTEFVQLYEPLIYQYGRSRGLQDADARDVTQNVLHKVAGAMTRFEYDPQKGRFRNWLGTITFREMRHYLRKRQVAVPGRGGELSDHTLQHLESNMDPSWIDVFNAHLLHECLRRIRPEFDQITWDAFAAVWLRDELAAETAAAVNRSVGWVYKAKYFVLQRLKQEMLYLAEDIPGIQR